jgi:4-amino-4-deoxy-L-arabinose transferase-like glycosyltransferase
MKYIKILVLTIIIALATFLRFYKLDQIPPSLNWDEVAAGYNAYTIANWGADEYGNKFPIVFRSFGDDKHPIHIYLTALMVKIFGLSDFSTRASSALVGTLGVLAIYFLVKKLLKSELAGIFSALFLAVSPYHLQYSRGLWEANFALFFLLLGLALFYWGIEKMNWMVSLSFISFGLSFFSYHSAKIVVPPLVLLLLFTHFKKLISSKKILITSVIIAIFFGGLIIKDSRILGFARVNQTKFSEDTVKKYGGVLQTYIHNYKEYFSYRYLFQIGDQNPRGSIKVIGEFYKIDLVLVLFGIGFLVIKKKWEGLMIICSWFVLSPIPGALSQTDPGSTRAIFMIGPIILLSGFGAASLIGILKKNWLKTTLVMTILLVLTIEVKNYLGYYFTTYPKSEAIEWQYGMKQIVTYLKNNPDYVEVYMDKIRQQPYIFFLYYFKTPLPELLGSVKYDQSESKSYNTVVSYGKYRFGGNWNIIDSYPNYGVIYIVTPSYYGGLRYNRDFEVKKLVKYPNGNDAFYIVEGYQQ